MEIARGRGLEILGGGAMLMDVKLFWRGEYKEGEAFEPAILWRGWRNIPGHTWNAIIIMLPIPFWREQVDSDDIFRGKCFGWFFRMWVWKQIDEHKEHFKKWHPWRVRYYQES